MTIAFLALVAALMLSSGSRRAAAQQGGLPSLEARVTALENSVATLTASLNAETARAKAAESTLQNNNTNISLTPGPQGPVGPKGDTGPAGPAGPTGSSPFVLSADGATYVLSGHNLQIVDGTGNKESTSGLGNLIVWYNELRNDGTDVRTGSHDLVVGFNNNYTSSGGLVAGCYNAISGRCSSVSGGAINTASGDYSSVCGGYTNIARNFFASVSGGQSNMATGILASVSGGGFHVTSGHGASISGGLQSKRPLTWRRSAEGSTIPQTAGTPRSAAVKPIRSTGQCRPSAAGGRTSQAATIRRSTAGNRT